MSKVFIIGAGFSKAIANAPLAGELFTKIYLQQKNETQSYREQYNADCNDFQSVFEWLQRQAKPLMDSLRERHQIVDEEGLEGFCPIHIEHLCTIIDLNIYQPSVLKAKGADLQGCAIPFIKGLIPDQLKRARKIIEHYIVELLLPEKLNPDWDLLDRFLSIIEPGDTIITFNYDLLLEQGLWKRGVWSPKDKCYHGVIDQHDVIDWGKVPESKVNLIKLHGSINWVGGSFLGLLNDPLTIRLTHPIDGSPLFEGMEVKYNREIRERYWMYPLEGFVIVPTFMKTFDSQWQVQLLKNSIDAIEEANEIFILGYSFPEADAIANLILSEILENTKINIIDLGDPLSFGKKLKESYLHKGEIICEESDIKDWINSDFKYASWEAHLKEFEFNDKMFGPISENNHL